MGINDAVPTPTGFAEIVSGDLPVLLHASGFLTDCSALFAVRTYSVAFLGSP